MIRLLTVSCLSVLLASCASTPYYDSPPQAPVNLLPVVGVSVAQGSEVTFKWRASERADHYDFHLFNRSNNDIDEYYQDGLDPASVCGGPMCSITLTINLPVLNEHAWRVRAGNNAGKSPWTRSLFDVVEPGDARAVPRLPVEPRESLALVEIKGGAASADVTSMPAPVPDDVTATAVSVTEVEVAKDSAVAPLAPLALEPINVTVVTGQRVEFGWQYSEDAYSYDFELLNSTTGRKSSSVVNVPASVVCVDGQSCQLRHSVELPGAKGHVWRVRAVNWYGSSDWSAGHIDVINN